MFLGELDADFKNNIDAFTKGGHHSTYLQKLVSATMTFDLCFMNKFEKVQTRIQKQILGNLSSSSTVYALLSAVLSKLCESDKTLEEDDPALDALYSVFGISKLSQEDVIDEATPMQNLFQSYDSDYMLVSVHSPIADDVNMIQRYLHFIGTK